MRIGSGRMRWVILTACLLVLAISVGLLIEASEVTRPPVGGIAILYIGVIVAMGFAGVGAFAWARRPKNLTGVLMVAVGTTVALTGLQFLDTPALFAIGAMFDTLVISVLVHLLLAFPAGRVEGRAARRIVAIGYAAAALQVPLLLLTPCTEDCPAGNLWLVADVPVIAGIVGVVQIFRSAPR